MFDAVHCEQQVGLADKIIHLGERTIFNTIQFSGWSGVKVGADNTRTNRQRRGQTACEQSATATIIDDAGWFRSNRCKKPSRAPAERNGLDEAGQAARPRLEVMTCAICVEECTVWQRRLGDAHTATIAPRNTRLTDQPALINKAPDRNCRTQPIAIEWAAHDDRTLIGYQLSRTIVAGHRRSPRVRAESKQCRRRTLGCMQWLLMGRASSRQPAGATGSRSTQR
jgi:hypothetical protein